MIPAVVITGVMQQHLLLISTYQVVYTRTVVVVWCTLHAARLEIYPPPRPPMILTVQ